MRDCSAGSEVKILLQYASANNEELGKTKDVIEYSVCIRSSREDIVNKFSDSAMRSGLTTRSYGVRYPENILEISNVIASGTIYKISFKYRDNGYIWEIHID